MSKLVPPKDIGVPVPTPALPAGTHLIAYYGPKGFTPSYSPVSPDGRIDVGDVSTLALKTVNGASYYDDPIGAELPSGMAAGEYDVYFTFADSAGDESNFSSLITVAVNAVPPTPGQPIVLG